MFPEINIQEFYSSKGLIRSILHWRHLWQTTTQIWFLSHIPRNSSSANLHPYSS